MSNMNGVVFNTDFSTIKPSMPTGNYLPVTTDKMGWLVQIIESGTRETAKKDGTQAMFKVEILDGQHKGFIGDIGFNIANPNQEAVRISFENLSAIAHVTGVLKVGNSTELHRKPFRVLVRNQKEPNAHLTEVYGFLDTNGNEPGKAGQGSMSGGAPAFGSAPQQPAQPPGGFAPTQGQQPAQGQQSWGQPPQNVAPQQAPSSAPAWSGGGAPGSAPGWAGGQGNG